jgi:hypothetical protein
MKWQCAGFFVWGMAAGVAVCFLMLEWVVPMYAQDEPSCYLRLVAQKPNIVAVIRSDRTLDGQVGPGRQIAYMGAQDDDRVLDLALEPDVAFYFSECMFTQRDPINYPTTAYLPMLGGRYRAR